MITIKCSKCDGWGYITIPAHQEGGYVVDEINQDCNCYLLKNQPNETEEWIGDN